MPNRWRTIKSLVHKIRLHGRRGKGMAESFSREKLRHAQQKEGGWEILCDLPPVWTRLVRPTNLMSRMNGKKTHNTHSSRARNELGMIVSGSAPMRQTIQRNSCAAPSSYECFASSVETPPGFLTTRGGLLMAWNLPDPPALYPCYKLIPVRVFHFCFTVAKANNCTCLFAVRLGRPWTEPRPYPPSCVSRHGWEPPLLRKKKRDYSDLDFSSRWQSRQVSYCTVGKSLF